MHISMLFHLFAEDVPVEKTGSHCICRRLFVNLSLILRTISQRLEITWKFIAAMK